MDKNNSNFVQNTIKVVFSNFAILLSSVLVALFIPKIMGVIQYGYYKLFVLYSVYSALLHFGLVDGILLYYGGKQYQSLNKKNLRSISRFFIFFEIIISILIIGAAQFINNDTYRYVFTAIGFYTSILNVVTYFQYITQAVMNFNLLSKVNLFQACSISTFVILLIVLVKFKVIEKVNYQLYVSLFILTYLLMLIFYIVKYKEIIFGIGRDFFEIKNLILNFFKIGLPVTISYQITVLILNLDNQYISMFFSTRTFGIYSFAYSLIALTTTIVNAISTVVFPYLNKQDRIEAMNNYSLNLSYILSLIYLVILVYFPIHIFIHWFLPAYVPSLSYFRLLLPGVGISSCVSIVIFNYFKIVNASKKYLIYGIVVLIIAVFFNYIIYLVFKSAYAIALSSLIVLFFWYLLDNNYLCTKYKKKSMNNTIYIIIMTISFELVTLVRQPIIAFFSYLIIYILVTFWLEKNVVNFIFNLLKKYKRSFL
ncbi:hypothetical protein EFR40_02795 [Limosilactobacillus fermentum]|uniref:oligosaccharide flippase family protein n=1 Tax=Limosilactobacillus fermentum TaxID=1613 RepID=UPI0021821CC0|nr:oligosaccharide flippase family protein [Limosilactobacillus fermentum]MCS8610530.1 hypothetical protein [Limosilactobacillus fermentum]MCT3464172.1 hypothetical protein [Limosilactobacillus fermentum]